MTWGSGYVNVNAHERSAECDGDAAPWSKTHSWTSSTLSGTVMVGMRRGRNSWRCCRPWPTKASTWTTTCSTTSPRPDPVKLRSHTFQRRQPRDLDRRAGRCEISVAPLCAARAAGYLSGWGVPRTAGAASTQTGIPATASHVPVDPHDDQRGKTHFSTAYGNRIPASQIQLEMQVPAEHHWHKRAGPAPSTKGSTTSAESNTGHLRHRGSGEALDVQARPQQRYWSIRLPQSQRRTFVIRAGRQRWRYTSLPFGREYCPVICQRLVQGIVSSTLCGYSATWHVYPDDVLIIARSQKVATQAIQAAAQALCAAGFVISPNQKWSPPRTSLLSEKD